MFIKKMILTTFTLTALGAELFAETPQQQQATNLLMQAMQTAKTNLASAKQIALAKETAALNIIIQAAINEGFEPNSQGPSNNLFPSSPGYTISENYTVSYPLAVQAWNFMSGFYQGTAGLTNPSVTQTQYFADLTAAQTAYNNAITTAQTAYRVAITGSSKIL